MEALSVRAMECLGCAGQTSILLEQLRPPVKFHVLSCLTGASNPPSLQRGLGASDKLLSLF